jgi:hypothetical protein
MGMTMKFVEIKLCRTCKENLNYKKFRKVNSLKKGYVKDNIIVVSMRANRIKSGATVDEIRKVSDFYEKLLKNK